MTEWHARWLLFGDERSPDGCMREESSESQVFKRGNVSKTDYDYRFGGQGSLFAKAREREKGEQSGVNCIAIQLNQLCIFCTWNWTVADNAIWVSVATNCQGSACCHAAHPTCCIVRQHMQLPMSSDRLHFGAPFHSNWSPTKWLVCSVNLAQTDTQYW